MSALFNTILYQPLFNALVGLYHTVAFGDLGIAIIILTCIIRVILYPLFYKSFRHQTLMQRIQPDIERIQKTHKENKQKQAEELMALYKTHSINPFSGLFLIFIQLPVLIALFRLFNKGITEIPATLFYSFVTPVATFSPLFLGLINLTQPHILIVAVAALLQYLQGRASIAAAPKPAPGEQLSTGARVARQMVFVGPVLTFVLLYKLPAAVGLYWLASTAFSLGQQAIINRSFSRQHHGTVPGNPQKSS